MTIAVEGVKRSWRAISHIFRATPVDSCPAHAHNRGGRTATAEAMAHEAGRPTLAAHVAQFAIAPIVKKKLLGGYELPFGPFVARAGPWLFEWGAVLGRARRDRLDMLAKVLADEGAELAARIDPAVRALVESGQWEKDHWTYEGLCKLASDGVRFYGREPDSFLDFWITAFAPPEADFRDPDKGKKLLKQKIRLAHALALADQWLLAGISFGATYPELTERLWKRAYETPEDAESQEIRALGRQAGLDVLEEQELRPLDEMEVTVLMELTNYLEHRFPELIEPLDLSEMVDLLAEERRRE